MSDSVTPVKKTYPVYFYVLALFIPVLFFAGLELSLRLAGYGKPLPMWEPLSPDFPHYRILNDSIATRYFPDLTTAPSPWPDAFLKDKADSTFRVFVLGESSAAGYPYDLSSAFSQEIERRLEILYPGWKIEVVNLSMSAISSFVLLDLTEGMLEQKPDLVLIYTGHNEYYGALGVGSSISIGNNRWLTKTVLRLETYRTVRLIRGVLAWVASLGSGGEEKNGTLMEQMVKEQLIPLHSPLYQAGIDQFQGNMEDILDQCKAAGVPVILSTLVSNLGSQPPFISEPVDSLPAAGQIFSQADSIRKANPELAKSLYIRAKELDLLRFRAPEAINRVILELGTTYSLPVVRADSVFGKASVDGIVGQDLMTDHLHPTAAGYRLLGKEFLEEMIRNALVPAGGARNLSEAELDHLADLAVPTTRLDSLMAYYKIKKLKMSWPFVKTSPKDGLLVEPENRKDPADVYAANVVNGRKGWENAHVELAEIYQRNPQTQDLAIREWKSLIAFFPFNDSPVKALAQFLIRIGRVKEAVPYLYRLEKLNPDAFSSKWLGIVSLASGKPAEAVSWFEISYRRDPRDAQMLYNFSGALFMKGEIRKSYQIINECLTISPDFPDAASFREGIRRRL